MIRNERRTILIALDSVGIFHGIVELASRITAA